MSLKEDQHMAVARDVMTTQVITVKPNTTIHEAIKTLVALEISGLVVTEDNGDILGVVTERDLLVAYQFLKKTSAPVEDYMNNKIISVSEETTVEEISQMLVQGDIRRVPVIKDKKVVGLVSRRDLLKNIIKQEEKQRKQLS